MQTQNFKDKRVHPRRDVNFLFHFKGVVFPGAPRPEDAGLHTSFEAVGTNLSQGGLGVACDPDGEGSPALKPGAGVLLEMRLEDGMGSLYATARVMWNRPLRDKTGPITAGMKFVAISSENLERIRRYVDSN